MRPTIGLAGMASIVIIAQFVVISVVIAVAVATAMVLPLLLLLLLLLLLFCCCSLVSVPVPVSSQMAFFSAVYDRIQCQANQPTNSALKSNAGTSRSAAGGAAATITTTLSLSLSLSALPLKSLAGVSPRKSNRWRFPATLKHPKVNARGNLVAPLSVFLSVSSVARTLFFRRVRPLQRFPCHPPPAFDRPPFRLDPPPPPFSFPCHRIVRAETARPVHTAGGASFRAVAFLAGMTASGSQLFFIVMMMIYWSRAKGGHRLYENNRPK